MRSSKHFPAARGRALPRGLVAVALVFCAAFPFALLAQSQSEQRLPLPFLKNDAWSGKAEIAIYRGQVQRYRSMREAKLALITVKEPWNLEEMVKAERTEPDIWALKQNQVLDFQTGVYPYHQMNSVFWNVGNGDFLKASMASTEWCGQTFKEARELDNRSIELTWNSYWEGENRGMSRIPQPKEESGRLSLLYDELPLAVRSPRFTKVDELYVFPMLMSSQAFRPDWDVGGPRRDELRYRRARLSSEKTTLQIAGKNFANVQKITVRQDTPAGEKSDAFYVNLDDPNRILLRWERNDGGVLTLDELYYTDYWAQNGPGDELQGDQFP